MTATHPETASGRERLDRRRILRTAVELIDELGLPALTMRRLGERLGVEAMALYHHVPSRSNLLDGVVEHVVDELYGDPEVHMVAPDGWQAYVQRLAHGVRRIALAHPEVFPLIATRPPAAPWVNPPLRSLRWMESFFETLGSCGFTDADAAAAYRGFSSFLLGHLLLEVAAMGVQTAPVEVPEKPAPEDEGDQLAEFPRLRALQDELSQNRFADEFADALEALLVRLEAVVAPG